MKSLLLATTIAFATVTANADTLWFKGQPTTGALKVTDVRGQLAAGKSIMACQLVKVGNRVNPTAVKGSKISYHADLSGGMDDVSVAGELEKGQALYRCSSVVLSGTQVKTVR